MTNIQIVIYTIGTVFAGLLVLQLIISIFPHIFRTPAPVSVSQLKIPNAASAHSDMEEQDLLLAVLAAAVEKEQAKY